MHFYTDGQCVLINIKTGMVMGVIRGFIAVAGADE